MKVSICLLNLNSCQHKVHEHSYAKLKYAWSKKKKTIKALFTKVRVIFRGHGSTPYCIQFLKHKVIIECRLYIVFM